MADRILRLNEMAAEVIGSPEVRCTVGVIKHGEVKMVGWGVFDPAFKTPRVYPMTAMDALALANELQRAAHEALKP